MNSLKYTMSQALDIFRKQLYYSGGSVFGFLSRQKRNFMSSSLLKVK